MGTLSPQLIDYLKTQPKKLKDITMDRWKELGPINLEDIIKFNNKEI